MANLFDSYGLDFLGKDEDTLMGAVRYTVQEGKAIKGYYDTPYFYLPIGSAEFWASSEKSEDGKLAISGFHTHCGGKTIWEMICTDVDISPKDWPKTERILMMSRSTDNGGMLPVDIITADVLPSFLKDDRLTLQLVAPCLEVNYYATEEEYDKTVPADKQGQKWGIADGALITLSFLANHLVGNYEDGKEYDNDAYITFKAKVTRLCVGTFEIGDQKENTFIRCFADTVYGELEFDHSFGQVPEELRDNIKVGSIISGVCMISADAAIGEYENGIVKDFDHDLRLVRFTLAKGETERLRSVLTADSVYETDTSGNSCYGADEIIDRLTYVCENHEGKYIAHLAEITELAGSGLEYPVGTKCIVLADKEEDNYESIVFVSVDEDGNISRIHVSTDSRYRFRIEKPERVKTPLDDMVIPESVVQPIIWRAKYHGFLAYDLEDKLVLEDEDYTQHKNNAERMLEALQAEPQSDAEKSIGNILGYLFAKSVEMTVNEAKENPAFETKLTASYSPHDAFRGVLRSTLPPDQHAALENAMEQARQFGKDVFAFMEMMEKTDDDFPELFTQAAVVVQRIGQMYASNGFEESCKART